MGMRSGPQNGRPKWPWFHIFATFTLVPNRKLRDPRAKDLHHGELVIFLGEIAMKKTRVFTAEEKKHIGLHCLGFFY